MAFFHCYRPHRFNAAAQATVDQANAIIEDMSSQGYTLTLRQLYYRFVAKDFMPNEEKQYKRLGRLVTQAREAGIMDWRAIEDTHRDGIYGPHVEEDRNNVVQGIEYGLNLDQWARQDFELEVWVEKQALKGVISRPCDRLDVRYMACKGYLSASEAWRAGLRFRRALINGKTPVLIHLADHDPSGLDMTDDNSKRLQLFAEAGVQVRRIALNMDQVEQYDPPPNPAKITDSRYAKYTRDFGPSSWELDALEPSVLDKLLTGVINEYRDRDIWRQVLEEQEEERKPLVALSENWDKVEEFLHKEGLV